MGCKSFNGTEWMEIPVLRGSRSGAQIIGQRNSNSWLADLKKAITTESQENQVISGIFARAEGSEEVMDKAGSHS